MKKIIFFILILYFFLIFQIPSFVGDEGYYSISISNAIDDGIKPYLMFFELPAFWKPPLMVNIYALISIPFIEILDLNIVYAYRIGSVIFSIINVILVYLISKEFIDEEKAKWITIIYALNPIILVFGLKIFMETLAMTFIFLGILGSIYFNKKNENVWLILIPLSIFGAAYTKSFTIGIMSILLCGLYFLLFNFNKINKFLLLTLIGIIACIGFAYYSGFPEMYYKLFMEDFFTNRMHEYNTTNLFSILSTILYLIPLFFVGWKKIDLKNKKDIFMIVWIIPLIPIALKTPFAWYAFYFILPIIYLALKGIDIKGIDLFIVVFLIILGIIFTGVNYYGHIEDRHVENYISENISKNDCIFIIGAPEVVIYSYLYHEEYNFNFVLYGGYVYIKERIGIHFFEKEEEVIDLVHNYLENEWGCIENEKSLFLNTLEIKERYYRSCNQNCLEPKYVFISSEPYVDIRGCKIIKEFHSINLWEC